MKKAMKLFCYFLLFSNTSSYAEVITDGTVGLHTHLSGQMTIPQSLGTTAGNNLFHSFQSFNINTGESAIFTGSNSIQNVISRVTGGQVSNINGLLKSEVGNANFYFINPAGVTFGANATIDVPAAFYVSTADNLRFADGKQFSAINPSASNLTIAEPVSFGFLGNHVADINVQNSYLNFKTGSKVSLSGSNIAINSGQIISNAGDIQLYATGNAAAEISLNQLTTDTLLGNLSITGINYRSKIDASGNGAGRLVLRAGLVDISNAYLFADNTGSLDASSGKGIDIIANNLTLNNSSITAESVGLGNAAPIDINLTGLLKITGDMSDTIIRSAAWNQGDASKVSIKANEVLIDGKNANRIVVGILSDAELNSTGGNAGVVSIKSNKLTVSNSGTIRSNTWSSGNAGTVSVDVSGDINLLHGGQISTSTFGQGNAGNIHVTAHNLLIDRQIGNTSAQNNSANNFLNANNVVVQEQNLNNAAINTINVNQLINELNQMLPLINAATTISTEQKATLVSSVTQNIAELNSCNAAGTCSTAQLATNSEFASAIIASSQVGSGLSRVDSLTGILSISLAEQTQQTDNVGTVTVNVNDKLSLVEGGIISTSTLSNLGNAGNVSIHAGQLFIDGTSGGTKAIPVMMTDGRNSFALKDVGLPRSISPGISSDNFFSTGHAGTVEITANTVNMTNGGVISSDTLASGEAGHVSVKASLITLDNAKISAEASKQSQGQNGNVTVTADKAIYLSNHGKISVQNDAHSTNPNAIKPTFLTVTAPEIVLKNSSITTESTDNVNASHININFSKSLKLDSSFITTSAITGNGGSITINGGGLISLENSGFQTSVTGANSNGGNINVTADTLIMNNAVIQADAVGGSGGDINLNLQALIPSHNQLIKGGAPVVWQPFIEGFNVIQAASANGVSGSVNLTSPQFNISGSISGLNSVALAIPKIDRWGCQASTIPASVLARGSRGGLPATEARYSFIPPANKLPVINQATGGNSLDPQLLAAYTPSKNSNYSCAALSSN